MNNKYPIKIYFDENLNEYIGKYNNIPVVGRGKTKIDCEKNAEQNFDKYLISQKTTFEDNENTTLEDNENTTLEDKSNKIKIEINNLVLSRRTIDLSYQDLSGLNLEGINLSFANLTGANLAGTNLKNCLLYYANLTGANLTKANICFSNLTKAMLIECNLAKTNFENSDLSYANLTNSFAVETNFNKADLTYANFQDVDLSKADLQRCICKYTNFKGSNFYKSELKGAKIKNILLNQETKFYSLQCPKESSFVAYMLESQIVYKIKILDTSLRSSGTNLKCRCDKAKILEAYDLQTKKVVTSPKYKIGSTIKSDFDEDRFNNFGAGIDFYMSSDLL